jgi:hypothetical protein
MALPQKASLGALFSASLPAAALTVALGWVGAQSSAYGFVLFLFLPVICGFTAACLLSLRYRRTDTDCSKAAALAVLEASFLAVLVAAEGVVCVLMVLPFVLFLAVLGGALAFRLQGRSPLVPLIILASAPVLMGAEAAVDPEPPLLKVRSEVVVAAPPEVVWPRVISFPELPEEREWLFRTGIAYPRRAVIRGSGPGALRFCVFSTGAFVEPVEIWDEPHLLRFAITQSPPSLREWSPWGDIRPPHTDSSFQGEEGQFELHPLPGGRTLLTGTTWYRQDLRPVFYWRLWSDAIVHRIHLRVLRHIARLAEEDVRAGRASG